MKLWNAWTILVQECLAPMEDHVKYPTIKATNVIANQNLLADNAKETEISVIPILVKTMVNVSWTISEDFFANVDLDMQEGFAKRNFMILMVKI